MIRLYAFSHEYESSEACLIGWRREVQYAFFNGVISRAYKSVSTAIFWLPIVDAT